MKKKDALRDRLIQEFNKTLDDHDERITKVEKLVESNSIDILDLQRQLRDEKIRNRRLRGERNIDIARDLELTPGRISQINRRNH